MMKVRWRTAALAAVGRAATNHSLALQQAAVMAWRADMLDRWAGDIQTLQQQLAHAVVHGQARALQAAALQECELDLALTRCTLLKWRVQTAEALSRAASQRLLDLRLEWRGAASAAFARLASSCMLAHAQTAFAAWQRAVVEQISMGNVWHGAQQLRRADVCCEGQAGARGGVDDVDYVSKAGHSRQRLPAEPLTHGTREACLEAALLLREADAARASEELERSTARWRSNALRRLLASNVHTFKQRLFTSWRVGVLDGAWVGDVARLQLQVSRGRERALRALKWQADYNSMALVQRVLLVWSRGRGSRPRDGPGHAPGEWSCVDAPCGARAFAAEGRRRAQECVAEALLCGMAMATRERLDNLVSATLLRWRLASALQRQEVQAMLFRRGARAVGRTLERRRAAEFLCLQESALGAWRRRCLEARCAREVQALEAQRAATLHEFAALRDGRSWGSPGSPPQERSPCTLAALDRSLGTLAALDRSLSAVLLARSLEDGGEAAAMPALGPIPS